jgi:predicted amidohydrolase YtcJ
VTGRLVIHDAEVGGRRVDVTCAGGVIVAVDPVGDGGPPTEPGVDAIDARGGAVLPGLHDHHIHLLATAAAARSVAAGPPQVRDAAQLVAALRRADRLLPPGESIRAIGYHESVAGPIDGDWLDALGIARPIRVQHRTGALWILNTAALFDLGLGPGASPAPTRALDGPAAGHPPEHVEADAKGRPTGRLFRADHRLRDAARLAGRPAGPAARPDEAERVLADLAAVGRRLTRFGITGVTDLTPTDDPEAIALLAAARRTGALPHGVVVTGNAALDPGASPELPRGPVKIVIDDHELPPFDWVVAEFTRARSTGRPIAVHSVTRESLVLALAAWDDIGVADGDRIEHGAVIPAELIADVRQLGLTVVTQPSFVRERGDHYLADVDAADVPHLWRCGSLIDAGIGVAFGSDAPYGSPDPWAMVRSAIARRTEHGAELGPGERVDAAAALDRLLGSADTPAVPRRIAPGAPADLCILDRPLADQLAEPDPDAVVATIVAGATVFHR